MKSTLEILKNAKAAESELGILSTDVKNAALLKMADEIERRADEILAANAADIQNAQGKIADVMIDRLRLDTKRISAMAQGIREVAALPDPVGSVLEENTLYNGLSVVKKRVPLGVIGIIYESRPNVTSDAGALCFKSGNVCVLRGGRDAFNSSFALVCIMRDSLEKLGLNPDFINVIEDTSRQSATELMTAVGYVDALIPRGGAGLIQACVENAKVPCIQTGTGICHVYVDSAADINMALDIIENAKTSRPSVCNAEEVCLVAKEIADKFLPLLHTRIYEKRAQEHKTPVQLRCDETSYAILANKQGVVKATQLDFDTEFLDYVLAVKVVENVDEAIMHIRAHSTKHSDCIVSADEASCEKFALCVDSAAVYINASTRFTDGGEFGKGCEIGISTQKLHARGPMGLEELCSYKYIVKGRGQVRV